MTFPEHGAWQQYIFVRADEVIVIPEKSKAGIPLNLSCLDAVGLGLHHIFALEIVRTLNLQPRATVLIISAGGAMVSRIQIALTRHLGTQNKYTSS